MSEELTHCCIICGKAFHPDGPDSVFCPGCSGAPDAKTQAEPGKDDATVEQPAERPAVTGSARPAKARRTRSADGPPGGQPAATAGESPSEGEPDRDWQVGDVILDLYEIKDIFVAPGRL